RCNDLTESEAHVPIGYPIGNTQCYVVDRYLQPVPPGVTGELHVGGDGVARGYLGQPAQTADKFVPDPFGGEPGARLYRTGDLAGYMVPASFVLLESLPLNANGKLDSRALQELGGAPPSDEPAEPSTVTEARLEAIWLEVLDVAALGVDDDFFALGGDSWQAV